jgi:hypothetical protein
MHADQRNAQQRRMMREPFEIKEVRRWLRNSKVDKAQD